MVPIEAHLDSLQLGIAGLAFQVRGLDSVTLAQLARRYTGFVPAFSGRRLCLDLDLAVQRGGPIAPDLIPRFSQGRLELEHHRFSGWIDAAAGRGQLKIEAQRPLEEIDYALRLASALMAWEAGGLMLHAAGLAGETGGQAFFGSSGSGKTTLASHAAGRRVLSDDLVLLLPESGGWGLHATPFSNPTQIGASKPGRALLVGLYCLAHAESPRLEALSRAEALAELVASVPVINADPSRAAMLLERLDVLTTNLPVSRLHLRPDASYWALLEPETRPAE